MKPFTGEVAKVCSDPKPLVRLRQPKKPRLITDIFLYLGHARAHDNKPPACSRGGAPPQTPHSLFMGVFSFTQRHQRSVDALGARLFTFSWSAGAAAEREAGG